MKTKHVINGIVLNEGQAMTIHVALQTLATDMNKKYALGKDEIGESIRKGYLKNVGEINRIISGLN